MPYNHSSEGAFPAVAISLKTGLAKESGGSAPGLCDRSATGFAVMAPGTRKRTQLGQGSLFACRGQTAPANRLR